MRPSHTIDQEYVQLSPVLPVRVQHTEIAKPIEPHDHAFYEVCYVEAGEVRHRTAHQTATLGAGDLIVIPLGGVHAFSHSKGCRVVNLYYLADWLLSELRALWEHPTLLRTFFAAHLFQATSFRKPCVVRLPEQIAQRISMYMADLEEEENQPTPSQFYLKTTVLKLMLEASRTIAATENGAPPIAHRPEVARAVMAIEEALARPKAAFSSTAIARQVGLSGDHLTRLFRADLGLTVIGYYQRRRIQTSARFLLDAERTIADVAYDLGYCDVPHFHRAFTRVMGLPPKRYRVQMGLGLNNTIASEETAKDGKIQ